MPAMSRPVIWCTRAGESCSPCAFDLKRLEVTGRPVPIVEGVWRAPSANAGAALFSVSDTGSLIYVPGPACGIVGPIGVSR